nr:CMF_HP1_G0006550.mRNA.1.CDS.1 [Saccharomyces cerevisiae]
MRQKKRTPKSKDKKQDTEQIIDAASGCYPLNHLYNEKTTTIYPVKIDHVTRSIDQRKPTPFKHGSHIGREDDDAKKSSQLPKGYNFYTGLRSTLPAFSKHDTGEVLFPKIFDNHEVDSIVSLERTRSTKSNKRSSMNSQRRSLTDTLSIKAQSEGMFITEASSVVLSTPDLTKSPASSILKNGSFRILQIISPEEGTLTKVPRMRTF